MSEGGEREKGKATSRQHYAEAPPKPVPHDQGARWRAAQFFPRSPRARTATTCRAVQQVVMTDGATFRVPSAVRMVSKTLALERDPANHPIYLVRALVLLSRVRFFFFFPSHHHVFAVCTRRA